MTIMQIHLGFGQVVRQNKEREHITLGSVKSVFSDKKKLIGLIDNDLIAAILQNQLHSFLNIIISLISLLFIQNN